MVGFIPAVAIAKCIDRIRRAKAFAVRQIADEVRIRPDAEIVFAVATDIAIGECRIVVVIGPAAGVGQTRTTESGAEFFALRQMADDAFAIASTDIGFAVAVDIGHANRRIILFAIPAVDVAPSHAQEIGFKRRALRNPASEASRTASTDVDFAIAVDIGESYRREVFGLAPSRGIGHIAEGNRFAPARSSRWITFEAVFESGAEIVFSIAIDIAKTNRRIILFVVIAIGIGHGNRPRR